MTGKVILEERNKVFLAPNGSGGCFMALAKFDVISQLKKAGVTHVHFFNVDNVLAKVADPYFLGCAAARDYDVTCKSISMV